MGRRLGGSRCCRCAFELIQPGLVAFDMSHDVGESGAPLQRAMSSSRRGRRPYTTLVTATRGGTRPRLSVAAALGAAALFGLSVPAGKALLAVTDPWLLAGLLYLGSGVSLAAYRLAQRFLIGRRAGEARLGRSEWPWLAAAIFTGGVIAPVLLMFGLSRAAAAEAALMLNLEGVFTAVVAWLSWHTES